MCPADMKGLSISASKFFTIKTIRLFPKTSNYSFETPELIVIYKTSIAVLKHFDEWHAGKILSAP